MSRAIEQGAELETSQGAYPPKVESSMSTFTDLAPSINRTILKEVEARLNISLPDDLKNHYLLFNGGRPWPNLFLKEGEYFAVNGFLPIEYGTRGIRLEDTYMDLVLGNAFFPNNVIPIAIDGGGDYVCYSLEVGRLGAICFYQSDYYDDPSRALVYLADSLEAFLSALVSGDREK